MKGDFSRRTFERKRHYTGVLMQQGRVQLDADWNEQWDIANYRMDTEATDVTGATGAPQDFAGFGIVASVKSDIKKLTHREQLLLKSAEPSVEPGNFLITPGRIYVDGIPCENEGLVKYTDQADLPGLGSPAAKPDKMSQAGHYLVYLDVWQRHVSAVEDPDLREKALGGPDTATRLKTVWQVKYKHLDHSPEDCDHVAEWDGISAKTTGTMEVDTPAPGTVTKPCALPPEAGYGGLENQLYRVEVHQGSKAANGSAQTPTFKWSRNNGSVVFPIVEFVDNAAVRVSDACRNLFDGLESGQWVELLDDRLELNGVPGQLLRIKAGPDADGKIELSGPRDYLDPDRHPKMRIWDGANITVDFKPQMLDPTSTITVKFAGNDFKPGDAWMIPVRTAIDAGKGSVELPLKTPMLPHVNAHHYCKLAVVNFGGNGQTVAHNCRKVFPPLTDLKASDISYHNTVCLKSADTVKEALDALCKRGTGDCSITIIPPVLQQETFDAIPDTEKNLKICLQTGAYTAEKTIVIKGKDSVRLTGCGSGTSVVAGAEAVFRFESCKSVVVKDLYAESTKAGPGAGNACLNGALTFCACGKVTVEGVELKCAPGIGRTASCINVRDAVAYDHRSLKPPAALTGVVRVRDCDLQVGHLQAGILLVNVDKVFVEDNVIGVYQKPAGYSMRTLLKNRLYRDMVKDALLSASGIDVIAKAFKYEAAGKSTNAKGGTAAGPQMAPMAAGKPYAVIGSKAGGARKAKKAAPAPKKAAATKKAEDAKAEAVKDDATGSKTRRMPSSTTDNTLYEAWNAWLKKYPPAGIKNEAGLRSYISKLAEKIILKESWAPVGKDKLDGFRTWLNTLQKDDISVAFQGIVVGGNAAAASDVRITGNDIRGVIQGIHVGLSHREEKAGSPDSAGRVQIENNYISVTLPPLQRERHGIFVGNCNSLSATNNRIDVSRTAAAKNLLIDGIRIYGQVGPMIVVRHNHISNANAGIRLGVLKDYAGKPQWIIGDNLAQSASIKPVAVEAPTPEIQKSIESKIQYYNTNFS